MTQEPDSHAGPKGSVRLVERLDKMVQAGRLTEGDAEGLRAAVQSGDLDAAVCEIQRKHARAMVTTAVEDGRLTQEEAHALFDRLENGEDPRFLRRLRRELRRPLSP